MTAAQIRSNNPLTPTLRGAWHLTGSAFYSIITNPFVVGFGLALPIVMYLMFGASQEYGKLPLGNGNVAAQILITMALYGALLGVASLGSNVALERANGISRLYALTPASPLVLIGARVVAAIGLGLMMIAATFVVGAFTGAKMAGWVWIASALVSVSTTVLGAVIGMACGMAIRSDASYAATSSILVIGGFTSGMFIPLEQMGGFFETLAPWTPLWGAVRLSLVPLLGAEDFHVGMMINFVAWTALFAVTAVIGWRKGTAR